MTTLYVVIPCYNEEEVLPETSKCLSAKFDKLLISEKISKDSRICFINDGSEDKTWEILQELHLSNPIFSAINLSRNRGHQNALFAGLITAKDFADCVISMDSDLQDDIDTIDTMLDKFTNEGCDIVYGVRDNRETDTIFKRGTAGIFYSLMKALGSESIPNHADFRLMSQRALEGLAQFQEANLFLRGMVPLVGFKSDIVYYKRNERLAGESKYPLKKMVSFAVDGITSMTATPMRLILWVGLVVFLFAIILGVMIVVQHFEGRRTVWGWASTMVAIIAFGGLQLLALGIIGEYVGKIFLEVKDRPRYIIKEFLNKK